MRNYILDSDILSKKTTDAYSMLYYMLPILKSIEETSKDAFEEIKNHNELGNEDYTSIRSNMEHIQEYMDKYKVFGAVTNGAGQKSSSGYNYNMSTTYQSSTVGYSNNDGFIGKYQREVDDIFYNAQVKTIQKLRDSKLQDIRVNNNVGIKGEVHSSLLTMQTKMSNGIDKEKISLEDLFGFGRISTAMHKEYEDMKAEVDAYNASLPQYSSKSNSNSLLDFINKIIFDAEIDKKKIDSYDEYIKKMVTSSDFDYETNGERMLSIGGYFIPIFGEYKMVAEIVDGKDLVSGRRYSVGEQLFVIGTMGAGNLIGKVYKGVKAGLASGVEETSGKIVDGTVLAMNGARDSSGIEKLAKSVTEKIVGKGESSLNPKLEKYINDSFEGTGKEVQDNFHKYLRENVWCDETLSNADKIDIMKANFDNLTSEQKVDFNVSNEVKVIKNPDKSNWGEWPDIDWPDFPGLNKDTAKSVYNEVTGNIEIPNDLDRLGSPYGNNLGVVENGYHCTQNERSICYIENEYARNGYQFDGTYYKDAIDAIKNFDIGNTEKSVNKINSIIDSLNGKNGTANLHITENNVADWQFSYKQFQSTPDLIKLCNETGIDSTYGVMGEAAPWTIKGDLITSGDAGQINIPINVKALEDMGIIQNIGGW